MIALLLALQIKHWIADWLLQPRYMHQNKGTLGHPGGILHAGFHGLLTSLILMWFVSPNVALAIGVAEFVAHYAIDYVKMNVNRAAKLVPVPTGPYEWPKSELFWIAVGVDQLLHQLCYVVIIWIVR